MSCLVVAEMPMDHCEAIQRVNLCCGVVGSAGRLLRLGVDGDCVGEVASIEVAEQHAR